MKKVLLVLVFILSLNEVNAQDVKIGGFFRLNFSSISFTDLDMLYPENLQVNGQTGFQIGAVAEISISEELSIAPEVSYMTAGGNYTYMGMYARINTSYLQVPLILKYHINENITLDFGPHVGLLLSGSDTYKYNHMEEERTEDLKNSLNSTDFGLNIGASYNLENGVFFNIRYSIGLPDTFKGNEYTMKNKGFLLGVGYFFNMD